MERDKRKQDRRSIQTDFRRRKLDRREGVYRYPRQAYLTDTNFFQNVYFAQYFDFMGEAREDLFKHLVGEHFSSMVQGGIGLSTINCSISYKHELQPYDRFEILVRVAEIKKIRVRLTFQYVLSSTAVDCALGEMEICFTKDGEPIPVPEFVLGRVRELKLYRG